MSPCRFALLGAPERERFAVAHALGRKGTFVYRPSTKDSGDTACQGAVNVDQLGLLATPDLLPVARNWLTAAVLRQPPLHEPGQVWSQPSGPYHGFGQGAMEANAEFILMASLYASYTGDRALFWTAPERLLCAEHTGENRWTYVGKGSWPSTACSSKPPALLAIHPQLFYEYARPPHTTVPRGKSKRGLYPGQGTVLINRLRLTKAATALSLAVGGPMATTQLKFKFNLNLNLIVRNVSSGTVVDTAPAVRGSSSGWVSVRPTSKAPFGAGVYDVALQAQTNVAVAWLSDSSPASSGGSRTEVYDEDAAPRSCCGSHAINSTLAAKLERALAWQLELSRKGSAKRGNKSTGYGMFVTADARFSGRPQRAKGITSSSAMWDQIRMGWKAAYPALRVLGSLVAWRELAAAGLVSATVDEQLVQSVRDDIATQLGQSDGTLLSWRSCEVQDGPPTFPSGLPRSSCDRDDPVAPNQRSFDLGFVPDHALAVKHKVISPHVLLQMMPKIRHRSGHRLAIKPFEHQYQGGLIMVDSEKWKYVDKAGFAEPRADQTGWSQVFAPPRTDGPGNFNNHEQNGGRLFSVSKLVLEAVVYPEAAVDWAEQVRGATAIAKTLLDRAATSAANCSSQLPFPNLVRTPMPADSLAHEYCESAYGCNRDPTSCATDCFGKTACDFYGDVTWGLRDGQLGPILELLKRLLGLQFHPDGTMRLYDKVVEPAVCTATRPCQMNLVVPARVVATWPPDIRRIELGGINAGTQRNVSIDANISYSDAISLQHTITSTDENSQIFLKFDDASALPLSHLRFMGYSDRYTPDASLPALQVNRTYANLYTDRDLSKIIARFYNDGLPGLLMFMESQWWKGMREGKGKSASPLLPGWETHVDAFARAVVQAPIGSVAGVQLGDELVCMGLPLSNLSAMAARLRPRIPPNIFIYTNECFVHSRGSMHACDPAGNGSDCPVKNVRTQKPGVHNECRGGFCADRVWPSIPSQIDYISLDRYCRDDKYCNNSADVIEEALDAAKEAQHYLIPLLQPHQRLWAVPGLFGPASARGAPARAEYDSLLVQKLERWLEVMRNDTRWVGLMGWHWPSMSSIAPQYALGASAFPKLLQKLAQTKP
eukprot:SAG31_NODE_2374_length_5842_cov_18.784433_1_plen_1112_part_00